MVDMEEVIVKTSKIYEGRVVKLDVHEVRLPDGGFAKREQINHPGAAAVVALDVDDILVLVRQFRLPAGQITLELPAGTLDPGEDPADCAVRELQEEAGYKPGKLERLAGFFVAPGTTTEFITIYLGTELQAAHLDADADEFVEVVRVPFTEALGMIATGEIVDSKTIIGLLSLARRRAV